MDVGDPSGENGLQQQQTDLARVASRTSRDGLQRGIDIKDRHVWIYVIEETPKKQSLEFEGG